jgi:hypothetical protein
VEKPDRSSEDPAVRREEAAAGAEAGDIGGPAPDVEGDEASRPVEEAGGGEAEGFEQSERELEEQATHGEGGGEPGDDAFAPEAESDRSSAEYGDPDDLDPES